MQQLRKKKKKNLWALAPEVPGEALVSAPCPSQGLAGQLFLWVCELSPVLAIPSPTNPFPHILSLSFFFFLLNRPWFALKQKKLNWCQEPLAHARSIFTLLHKSPNVWHGWRGCLLSNNLIWTAAGFSNLYQTCEMNIPKMQPRWVGLPWGPWLLLYTRYEAMLTALSYPPKHIQYHNVLMRKLMFYWGFFGACERGITSHTYHWAETESITPADIFVFSHQRAQLCWLPLLSSFFPPTQLAFA